MYILDLNDYRMALLAPDDELVYQDCAAAAMRDNQLVFGEVALQVARKHPQQFNQKYLGTLSALTLPSPLGSARNLADLVYHHFGSLPLANQDVAIIVPPQFSNEQLGLLVGICQELNCRVRGFIDAPLCQAMQTSLQPGTAILDIELQRLTVTPLEHSTDEIAVASPTVWEGQGFLHLFEGWMSAIADEFVARTRFDPLHAAGTEQQVADQLWHWCHSPAGTTLHIKIANGDAPHETDIQRHLLDSKLKQRLSNLQLDNHATLALSDRAAHLPGLVDAVRLLAPGTQVLELTESGLTQARALTGMFSADGVTRIRHARQTRPQATAEEVSTHTSPPPTHLLRGHVARPIAAFSGSITEGIQAGDEVTLQNERWLAIRVEDI